eukprot:CCRYP_019186-RA/>CCRYP_019186-RA protein AED:0.03 eAED:0.03 QI:106/1/1/1/1/1/2/155/382
MQTSVDYSYTPVLPSVTHYSRRINTTNHDSTQFRPRYSAEESSDDTYQLDLRNRLFQQRKRRALGLFLLVLLALMLGMAFRLNNFLSEVHITNVPSTKTRAYDNNALRDSDGFFDNISNEEWGERKQETKAILDRQDEFNGDSSNPSSGINANIVPRLWWLNNWNVSFPCDQEVPLGNKFICNPVRIVSLGAEQLNAKKERECIIYASGGNDIEFGAQFLDYAMARVMEVGLTSQICEVHIFNPNMQAEPQYRDGLFLHKWGFYPSNRQKPILNGTLSDSFKTIEETMKELNHMEKTLSILALDCEGCEWDMFHDILSLSFPIQQLIIQVHGVSDQTRSMFAAMQSGGYVITHKEAAPHGNGEVYDYSFLRLSQSFFDERKK